MKRDAYLSECGAYRYWLTRVWDTSLPLMMWIMVNPSTAGATQDDATIRRCIGFAKSWGYGGFVVVNLFALRSTDPKALKKHPNPDGPENDRQIMDWAGIAELIVCAWGANGALFNAGMRTMARLNDAGHSWAYLAKTNGGQPAHPLFLSSKLEPIYETVTL